MEMARILVVDDDEMILLTLTTILGLHNFHVTTASNVAEALRHISSNQFDVLLTDLHMPAAGDGLTVVSAMRHANPQAVTLLLSAFPAINDWLQRVAAEPGYVAMHEHPVQIAAE